MNKRDTRTTALMLSSVWAVCLSASFALLPLPCEAQVLPGFTRPSVLPMADFRVWNMVAQDNYAAVKDACRLTDQDVDALLASADPLDRGIGVFLLDQRCDLQGLIEVKHLLDDHAPSIPSAAESWGLLPGEYHSVPQTVRDHMRRACAPYVNKRPADQADFDVMLAGMTDPNVLATAWIHRICRAQRADFLARPDIAGGEFLPCIPMRPDVIAGIDALPANIRWVVVCSAADRSANIFPETEAAAMLQLAAVELGGQIDPDTSPVWTQPGMTLDQHNHQKKMAVSALQRIAPNLISPQE